MAARVRNVVWAQSARDALDEVIEYIARDSRSAAIQVLDEALRTAASLDIFSERGRIVPEVSNPAIRELLVFRYRLLYEVRENLVTVVAFLHGARDFATWRRNQEDVKHT